MDTYDAIAVIKFVRMLTGLGLKESKQLVDWLEYCAGIRTAWPRWGSPTASNMNTFVRAMSKHARSYFDSRMEDQARTDADWVEERARLNAVNADLREELRKVREECAALNRRVTEDDAVEEEDNASIRTLCGVVKNLADMIQRIHG